MESIRILHLDPDRLMSSLLQEYLTRQQSNLQEEAAGTSTRPSYLIKGVSSGEEALILLAKDHYDLVLMEITLPKMSGYAALKAIRASFPDVKVLVLSQSNNINMVNRCIQLGAFSFISKNNTHERLHVVLDIVASGSPYFEGNSQMLVLQENTKSKHGNLLSAVDLEILICLHQGMSRIKLARHLGLADRTIDAHIHVLLKKLGVRSRIELVIYAERYKLV